MRLVETVHTAQPCALVKLGAQSAEHAREEAGPRRRTLSGCALGGGRHRAAGVVIDGYSGACVHRARRLRGTWRACLISGGEVLQRPLVALLQVAPGRCVQFILRVGVSDSPLLRNDTIMQDPIDTAMILCGSRSLTPTLFEANETTRPGNSAVPVVTPQDARPRAGRPHRPAGESIDADEPRPLRDHPHT